MSTEFRDGPRAVGIDHPCSILRCRVRNCRCTINRIITMSRRVKSEGGKENGSERVACVGAVYDRAIRLSRFAPELSETFCVTTWWLWPGLREQEIG
jgi:hypothetical protein